MTDISKLEIGILFTLAILFQFAAVNVNPTLGNIYTGFAILAAIFIILDPKRQIHLKSRYNQSSGLALLKGAVSYIILVLGGSYVIVPGVQAVRNLLSSTTPVLAQNAVINNTLFGVGVPVAETFFLFAVALDILASLFNFEVKRSALTNLKTWIAIIGLSLLFMFFHLTAKGIGNFETLSLVFFMAIISLILIIYDESYESALYFHIIANLSALLLI